MKVVKTHSRWRLYQKGFRVALRFNTWSDARAVESWLQKNRGSGWSDTGAWHGHFGTANGRNSSRPYFIGLRNPQDVTVVLLAVDQ